MTRLFLILALSVSLLPGCGSSGNVANQSKVPHSELIAYVPGQSFIGKTKVDGGTLYTNGTHGIFFVPDAKECTCGCCSKN